MHAVDIGIAQQNTETTVTQREQMRQFVMENEQNLDRTRLPYIMRIILWFVTMALVAENALHSWDEWTFCYLLWLLKKLPCSYQLCKHDKTVGLRLTLCSFVIFNWVPARPIIFVRWKQNWSIDKIQTTFYTFFLIPRKTFL